LAQEFLEMKITIRRATTNDTEVLTTLGKKTFFEKWKDTTSSENMKNYLSETFNEEKLREETSDPSIIYLLAEENSVALGYAKLLHTHPDIEEAEPEVHFTGENPLEISRIYVAPELIGKNIGAKLMEKIFEIAHEEKCDLIWLGVWENNPATRFYQRHGFAKAGTHKFSLGDQVDTDWVMIKKL
jgi:ribosomal protein S18 acetylase RimI-like enzyme